MDSIGFSAEFLAKILALLVGIIGHEIMHGYVAYQYGDTTAKDNGRLKINPLMHIDLVGSIIIPLVLFLTNSPFLFGWAKPVPVNMEVVVKNGGFNGGIAVSLAGIFYNFIVAGLAAIIIFNIPLETELFFDKLLAYFIMYSVIYNIVLGVFNLWPIPPLDGANALSFLGLKFGIYKIAEWNGKIGNYGMIFLIAILSTPFSIFFFYPAHKLIQFLL